MKQLPHDEGITRSNFFKVHSTTLDAKPDRILKSYLCRIILRMPKKYSAIVRCANTKTIAQPPSCTCQLGSLRCILASTPPCFALRK
ncbi:MAG: hypothetical protein NT070_13260 [Cyanobacteria bacterium]|nr:hypothetical protein [Cyanobacteriota bacterium]